MSAAIASLLVGVLLVGCADCSAEGHARAFAGASAVDCGNATTGERDAESVVACIEDADARGVAFIGVIGDGAIESGDLWLVRNSAGQRAWFVYRWWGDENRGASCLGPFERRAVGFATVVLVCPSSEVVDLCRGL